MLDFAGVFAQQSEVAAPPVGGYPVVQSVTNSTFAGNATTHNVTMPAIVDAGDLLICFFSNDSDDTVTTPSGWTQMYSILNADGDGRGSGYKKVASGSEDGTTVNFVTSGSEQGAAQVFRITNWGGSLTHVVAGTPSTANNPPALTSGFGVVPTLWIVAIHTADGDDVSAPPTNYTNLLSSISDLTVFGAQVYTARRELTAASEDPGGFTSTFPYQVTNIIAVRGG